MTRVLLFFALVACGWRLTRLLVVDEFPPVKFIRERVFVANFATVDPDGNVVPDRTRWGRLARVAHSVAYLWVCPWCMSVWAAVLVWGIADWPWWGLKADMSVPWPWAMIALTSLLAGWDANMQGEHDKRWELMDRRLKGEIFDHGPR